VLPQLITAMPSFRLRLARLSAAAALALLPLAALAQGLPATICHDANGNVVSCTSPAAVGDTTSPSGGCLDSNGQPVSCAALGETFGAKPYAKTDVPGICTNGDAIVACDANGNPTQKASASDTLCYDASGAVVACGVVQAQEKAAADAKAAAATAAEKAGKNVAPEPVKLVNPLSTGNVNAIIARVIQLFTGIAGSIALLMFVYGGFLWVTAGARADHAKKAQEIFKNAVLGLVVIFGAYAMVSTLLSAFAKI
jgi:hypothetical protein